MSIANQRIPVLVTEEEKARIAQRANNAGISMGEYMRRAAASFDTEQDEASLEAMIEQMLKATASAEAAIDDALGFVELSNQRIARMEAEHLAKKEE